MYGDPKEKDGAGEMDSNKKVTNIRYKQADRDPKTKAFIKDLEQNTFGDKGVGLFEYLGFSPGKILKHLDDKHEEEFEDLLREHEDYIFWEARKRSNETIRSWLEEMQETNQEHLIEERLPEIMQEAIKAQEIKVVEELVNKHMG